MSPLNANTVILDDACTAAPCHGADMACRRPRVALHITPRLLQDTLSVALSQHADVVDLTEWRERGDAGDEGHAFDVAVVSGGMLPDTIAAELVIDIDARNGLPTLHSLQERLRGISASTQ